VTTRSCATLLSCYARAVPASRREETASSIVLEVAPQVGFEPTTLRLTGLFKPGRAPTLPNSNQVYAVISAAALARFGARPAQFTDKTRTISTENGCDDIAL
jgi:hypothetical protein